MKKPIKRYRQQRRVLSLSQQKNQSLGQSLRELKALRPRIFKSAACPVLHSIEQEFWEHYRKNVQDRPMEKFDIGLLEDYCIGCVDRDRLATLNACHRGNHINYDPKSVPPQWRQCEVQKLLGGPKK